VLTVRSHAVDRGLLGRQNLLPEDLAVSVEDHDGRPIYQGSLLSGQIVDLTSVAAEG